MDRKNCKVANDTLVALKHRRGCRRMRNGIVLGVEGMAPDFAVCMGGIEQSVTSPEVELKL
jgi:hypothetical protein